MRHLTITTLVMCGLASSGIAADVPEAAAVPHGKSAHRTAEQRQRGDLAWWKVVADADTVQAKGENDKLRIRTTHTVWTGEHYRAYVLLRWGDLDNGIVKGGKQYYSNWDGELLPGTATAKVVRKLAFDDQSGKAPKEGSGVDKLDRAEGSVVSWRAGVVGATDGLLIEIDLPGPTGSVIVNTGGFNIPLALTAAADDVRLPDGTNISERKARRAAH